MSDIKKINLSEDERRTLEEIVNKGKDSPRKIKRAIVLLMLDQNYNDENISKIMGIGVNPINNLRNKFIKNGLEDTINDKKRNGRPKKLNDKAEALLIATVNSAPPEGKSCWSLRLLSEKLSELNISHELIRRTLKKLASQQSLIFLFMHLRLFCLCFFQEADALFQEIDFLLEQPALMNFLSFQAQ